MTAIIIDTARLPYGYTLTQDGDRYRLWRSSEVETTDDGFPDEIEDGYPSVPEAVQSARECAGLA